VAARFFVEKNNLFIQGWSPGSYDRSRFSTFLDAFNGARTELNKAKDVSKYIK
jgi:hypothetical protein